MEEDTSVRMFAEFICSRKISDVKEILRRYPSFPRYFITEDFSQRMKTILYFSQLIVIDRWHSFFDNCYQKWFSSHEIYLTFIMFVCIKEQRYHQNIFDSFVSVCILINLLNDETLSKTGVNFFHLNPDIIMIFYQNELKFNFNNRRGLRRLEESIRSHKFLKGKYNKNNLLSSAGTTVNAVKRYIPGEFKKEIRDVIRETTNPDEVINDKRSIELAKLVLSIPSIKLPILPNYTELIARIVEFRKAEIVKKDESKRKVEAALAVETSKVNSHGSSSPFYDSNANCDSKHPENINRYESIIQAVLSYNHSKNSEHENMKSGIQEEAGEILVHLKDSIKSLIDVLNEYDNE